MATKRPRYARTIHTMPTAPKTQWQRSRNQPKRETVMIDTPLPDPGDMSAGEYDEYRDSFEDGSHPDDPGSYQADTYRPLPTPKQKDTAKPWYVGVRKVAGLWIVMVFVGLLVVFGKDLTDNQLTLAMAAVGGFFVAYGAKHVGEGMRSKF